MAAWSAQHAETIEALLSHALTGRWVGVVGGTAPELTRGLGGGGTRELVVWQHQAANTHADCFYWSAHTQSITTMEAGVYEVGMGLWPPSPGLRAELQVDGRPAALASGTEAVGAGAAGAHGLPQSATRSEACGLVCITLLSLHAGAVITLATDYAAGPTKAYLGMRKL